MPRRVALLLVLVAAALVAIAAPATARSAELSTRIVGGGPTTTADWPWMVYLEVEYEPDRSWACGGSVVSARLIVTAAHCVLEKGKVVDPAGIRGIVGRTDLRVDEGTSFGATRIAVHPNYDRDREFDGGPYDVAVIEADIDIPATPIALATTNDAAYYAAGVVARAAGWGLTSQGGSASPILQQVDLPIISDALCARQDQISEAEARMMLCAGLPQGGVDTCQGDSGGPLVVYAGADTPDPADDRWLLAGTTSWGYECAEAGRYGLYARAATFAGWVGSLAAGDESAWNRATDQTAPVVKRQRAARQRAGRLVRFYYRVVGETGRTRETITIRRRVNSRILRRVVSRLAVNPAGRDSYLRWRVPARMAPGRYVWCITSKDEAGNRSKQTCRRLTVLARR